MGHIREYFARHREVLMTLAVLLILDHFLFDGAFKAPYTRYCGMVF